MFKRIYDALSYKFILLGYRIKKIPTLVFDYLQFIYLLVVYLVFLLIRGVVYSRFAPHGLQQKLTPLLTTAYYKSTTLSRRQEVTINRINLIDLAFKNMRAKPSRTIITVGGMAVGIGAIVLLQSIGFGLQELVVGRVARLDELKQIHVSTRAGSDLVINDATIEQIGQITNVATILPQISLAGRVSYQNAISDVAVYGVTAGYLEQSAITTSSGSLFESNDIAFSQEHTIEQVAQHGQTLAELATIDPQEAVQLLPLPAQAIKQAIVTRAFLDTLGIPEAEAIGQSFEASFIIVGNLVSSADVQYMTIPALYTIVGVTIEDVTPFFYVPFIDLRGIGITQYSQLKVIMANQDALPYARQLINSLGFATDSVYDTVAEIDTLFGSFRVALAVVGLVAVAIASLGMFNTLTVSLLERTREVGFMKALGMKSYEIRDLFLTESLIMGIMGGLSGLLFGVIAGECINLILSVISWTQGGTAIDITYIPHSLTTAIGILGLAVGIVTGIYPAMRATKISALNALRYE